VIECLQAENARLQDDLAEHVEDAFCQLAHLEDDGWRDTMASSTAMDLGDKLCELGLWERRPGGHGRRQWYRPVAKGGE
jgi:hypothetical protein